MIMRYKVIEILIIITILIGIGAYYIKPYYTPAKKQKDLIIQHHHDDTIRIAYIGDSWADGHKRVRCVIDLLISDAINQPVVVKTAGISGLTSKNVYYGLFRNGSMRSVIEWGPDFCFVVAGINDSDRKMGKSYYKENMRLIIELLLENRITPIILEIPSYDIEFSYKRRSRPIKLQYIASMLLTWSKMNCIESYRKEYKRLISEQNWEGKAIFIANDEWNPDGYKDARSLYDGGRMHLTAKGYLVLDSCIAHKIINYVNASSNNRYH